MPSAANHTSIRPLVMGAARFLGWLCLAVLALGCRTAHASNPRWVTGPPYFNQQQPGIPVIWYTRTPQYFTDPGDLSPYVDHATADALVAAAANVWNVPTADFTPAQGGTLAEHVSGANAYPGANGIVFPADVDSSNFNSVQIAVLYDTDGSITDMLLGSGASAPMECLQNGVTESVDSITPGGFIQHAVIVLNGRCSGPAPEQQLQLRYQLQRAFGRVFGVGWSQTNDNVFTRNPTPTYAQAQHWPIMHPIDIVCGPYTYQCLPDPFTLRDDDVAAITQLYILGYNPRLGWIGFNQWLPGKIPSYTQAARAYGAVTFPNGQGMQGVNIIVQREPMFTPIPELWQEISSISGYEYRQSTSNPITAIRAGMAESMGTTDPGYEGHFDLGWLPLMSPSDAWVVLKLTWEPINPLYTGSHAVGPYVSNAVAPSGAPSPVVFYGLWPSPSSGYAYDLSFSPAGATSTCAATGDGVESSPAAADPGGWWTGTLCGYNHSSWTRFSAGPGHTATVEVTALDEKGLATSNKALPLIGVWNASDPTGTAPTVTATPAAFNTVASSTTALTFTGTQAGGFRIAVADARGDGRPDYNYRARILYADSVQPAIVSQGGSQITITGMGFRPGSRVLVNGVPAIVSNASANSITAVAPPVSAFRTSPGTPVDIQVQDPQTGGTSTLTGALTYGTVAGDVLTLVSSPLGAVQVNVSAGAFAVRVLQNDGITAVAGMPVAFTAAGASVSLMGCTGTPCIAFTDASGVASVTVTPVGYGSITLTAVAAGSSQSATFRAVSRTIAAAQPTLYVAAGATFVWNTRASLLENNAAADGISVAWTGSHGLAFSSATGQSNTAGGIQDSASVGPLTAADQAAGQACGWTGPVGAGPCATFAAIAVDPSILKLALLTGGGQRVATTGTFAPVVVQVTDPAGHPVAGASVTLHQSLDQLQMPCPDHGACPIPQGLGGSTGTLVSDANGLVTAIPAQIGGQAEVTHLALACGTAGFLSLSLTQGP